MTTSVTTNLALLSAAPGGIKALRQLILDLAIAGRLLPQLSSDQPAEAVLIATAAMRSGTAARRSGSIRNTSRAERLPGGWVATTVGEVLICRDGDRVPVSQADREGRPKIYDYYGASGVIDKIDDYLFDKPLLLVGEDGANLINRSTPIAFIARGKYWVNNHAHVLDGVDEGLLQYMALYFNAIDLKPYVTGTAQPKLNQAKLNAIPVSLPPQGEQQRIVAKVDELMALCDRLEARQQDAEAAHARLVRALLDSLTQACDAEEFQVCWRRVAGQFGTLFVSDDSLQALRQAVIDCATSGQFPPSTGSTEWRDGCFGDLVVESGSGWSPSCEPRQRNDAEWGVLKVSAVSWGSFRPDENKALPASLTARPEFEVRAGDFLISRANTADLVARSVFVETTPPKLMLSDKIVRLRFSDGCEPRFAQLANSSTAARRYYSEAAGGTSSSMKNVTRSQILALPIKYPGLAEQRRIVAQVTELLALCDQLKARIAAARAKRAQLAEALLAQAVAA